LEKFKSKEITNLTIVCNEKLQLENYSAFNGYYKFSASHLWKELTKQSQERVLERKVNFQGIKMKLKEIFYETRKAIEKIPLDIFLAEQEFEIGKENNFDEVKFHVERNFLTSDANWNDKTSKFEPEPLSSEELFKIAEKVKVILLADEPGNGKSTEMKMIAKKLKRKFPFSWVEYFDLKLFTKDFQKDGKVTMKFDKVEEIARFLAEKMLKLESFKAETFVEMFINGCVIALFDGVDEISPSFLEFVMKLMVGSKTKSQNLLFISARPHLVCKLEQNLKTKSFKLVEFSDNNRKEFLMKFFQTKDILKVQREKFLEKINTISWSNKSVLNPMLCRMTAEICEDPNFQLVDANLFSIYDEFVSKMIKNLRKKGPEAEKDATKFIKNVDIIECHQRKAVEIMSK
jgi:NACHT domain